MPDAHPVDGNASALMRYWSTGKGGTERVRWNEPGSYERCVRLLTEHGLTDPHGYCAKACHEATGEWPKAHHDHQLGKR